MQKAFIWHFITGLPYPQPLSCHFLYMMAWNILWISIRGLHGILGTSFFGDYQVLTYAILIILGNLSEYFPCLDSGVYFSLGYLMSGLGLPTLRDFLRGLLVQILGTFAYLVNIGIWTSSCPNFFYGLYDRTGRPNIGQSIYLQGEPFAHSVSVSPFTWLTIYLSSHLLVVCSRGSRSCRELSKLIRLVGHGAHRAFKWVGNRESIHHIFILGKLIWELFLLKLGISSFCILGKLIGKAYWESLLGNFSWNLLSSWRALNSPLPSFTDWKYIHRLDLHIISTQSCCFPTFIY